MAQGVVVVVPTILGLGTVLPKKDRSAPKFPTLAVVMNTSSSRTNTRSLARAQLVIIRRYFFMSESYFIP